MTWAIIVMAAGQSRRMRGRDKLREHIDGVALIRRVVNTCADAGTIPYVTLPPRSPRQSDLAGVAHHPVYVGGDMSDSLRAGIRALPDTCTVATIVLADMPDVTPDMITQVTQACLTHNQPSRAVTQDGQPGHPVALPARLFADAMRVQGDTGMRGLLRFQTVIGVPTPGAAARTDLDSPEDWAAWRISRAV